MWTLIQNGGPVIWPLLACSIISVAFLLDRFFFWILLSFQINKKVRGAVLNFVKDGQFEKARIASANSKDPVLECVNEVLSFPSVSMRAVMDRVVVEKLAPLKRYHTALDLIVSLAPLLGILGTVIGIIVAFQGMGGGVQDPKMVTAGISESLICTAFGLCIATTTMVGAYFSAVKAQHVIHDTEISLSTVEQYYA